MFTEGAEQLTRRFVDAAGKGEDTKGMVDRYANSMIGPFDAAGSVPIFGHGLGTGTNAAAGMLRGKREFTGPEDEWGSLFYECGSIFGLL